MIAIRAIETRYRGVYFRSRLEARWAAFFDAAGWSWEYEPFDTAGWIPDFVLKGKKRTALVEVKPILWPRVGVLEHAQDKMIETIRSAEYAPQIAKAWRYAANLYESRDVNLIGWPDPSSTEVLILGTSILSESIGGHYLGVILNELWGNLMWDAACLAGGHQPQVLDFHAFEGSYEYRIGGQYEGDRHIRPANKSAVEDLWGKASRAVRYEAQL